MGDRKDVDSIYFRHKIYRMDIFSIYFRQTISHWVGNGFERGGRGHLRRGNLFGSIFFHCIQHLEQILWLQYWKDPFLTWDPSQYDGVKEIQISSDRIWTPVIGTIVT